MNPTLIQAAAYGLGNLRMGRRPVPGQGRLVDALGKVAGWIAGNCSVGMPWPGVQFESDLTDRIQRQMWAGAYEPHVRECFAALLGEGNVYFDVGAHIGYHAAFASYKVGKNGQVSAFEADPGVYQRLAKNLTQFPWAIAIHAAVWETNGELRFGRSPVVSESGWGTVREVRDFGEGEQVTVPAISIDKWLPSTGLTRWDAMKLDAEGSELAVLRGARNSLERFQPIIILEMNGSLLDQGGTSPAEVAKFLTERGYRLFHLIYRKLTNWDPSRHNDFCDVIALPELREKEVFEKLADRRYELAP